MTDPVDLKSEVQKIMRSKHVAEQSFQLILNSIENCPRKSPTFSSFSINNFKNAINFNPPAIPDEENHILVTDFVRNKHLKDSPYPFPKCCAMFSNIYRERRSGKKLKQYNLIKQLRKPSYFMEKEEPDVCETVITDDEYDKIPVNIVDEGFVVPDSESEEDSNFNLVIKKETESLDDVCSGCSTLEGTYMRKVKPKEKREIRTEIPKFVDPYCAEIVRDLKIKQKEIKYPKCCL